MRLSISPDKFSSSPSPSPPPPLRHRRRCRRAAPPSPSSQEPSSDYEEEEEDDDPHETGDDTEVAADSSSSSSSSSSFNSSPNITPPTYVNVAPLPVFRGVDPGECPVEHLARFDRACRANNAADPGLAARVFPASLDSDAALWYELAVAPLLPAPPWPAVRSAFLLAFQPPDFAERARAQLMSLRQGEAESASRYHLRLQWILKRWPEHGIPDALLKGIFIDGLREGFQEWVVTQKPETLAAAVGLAMSWERAEGVREARRRMSKATAEERGDRNCGFCGETGHEEGACAVRRRMRELWLRSKDNGGDSGSGSGGGGGGGVGGGGGGGSVMRREGEGEEGGVMESLRRSRSMKSTCQCWKHQCWKKVERSSSTTIGEGVDECQGDG